VSEENLQTPATQQDKKEERTDELDIIGGLLIRFVKYFFSFYRKLFKSQEYQK
jgi:hypothetical protein